MIKKLLLLFIVVALAFPVMAQTEEPEPEPHPLFQLLALIPDDPMIEKAAIGFSDFIAAEAARPAAGKYTAWAEYEAAKDSLEAGLWANSFPQSGLGGVTTNPVAVGGELPAGMGFEIFDIDYAASFGAPPDGAQLLVGNFDFDAIHEARLARGMTLTEINGYEAWCAADGCDKGQRQILSENNRSDLFGGNLGRKQPTVLIGDSFLFSSPSLETAEQVLATHEGTQPSLLENELYVAAAEAVTREGMLRQLTFIPVSLLVDYDAFAPEIAAQIRESADPLPEYALLVFADIATDTDQQAVIGLVYDETEDAETAAEVIAVRLDMAPSVETGEPWLDSLQDTTLDALTIYESDNGKTVLMLVFRYPRAPDAVNDAGLLTQAGINYTWLLRSFFGRDLLWLGTESE